MVYVGVCARLHGEMDSHGDILSDNVAFSSENAIPVTHEFHEKSLLGHAYLERSGMDILAYVHLVNHEYLTPELVENLHAVVGGSISKRDGALVQEWTIRSIGLTISPSDKTLPKLKLAKRNECCTYSGPPFRPCKKCGSRQTI